MLRTRGGLLRGFAGLVLLWAGSAWASGPRWVTGPPYFTTSGQPVIWYTDTPKYFTDRGDLSSSVNHAAADRLVAAAAGVWNIPTSRLTLAQGGVLDEHVSGANAYPDANGIVFPADVQPTNYLAKQIAVIYDYDGSVTDLLLGVGGSDPTGCRNNAVTESVDSIVPAGFIQHAVIVLNGRCTGTAAEKQLQMQYQLMRAFGRVLGLSWSQTNDNVFTNSPTPTPQQELHWPVMHPIDIICGPYTYQCMPQPFKLRMDDVAGMALLYFIDQGQAGPGKTDTLQGANQMSGIIQFPNGKLMDGVNVVGRRLGQYLPDSQTEAWESVSSVSGYQYRQMNGTSVLAQDTSAIGSQGDLYYRDQGWYSLGRIENLPGGWQWTIVETQAVNPLYTGAYSVGTYRLNTTQPSGSNQSVKWGLFLPYGKAWWIDLTVADAAATCSGDGSGWEGAPQAIASTGWWSGQLCGYGWTSWSSMTTKANRSMTIEVTAQDEQGFATTAKALPVIGVWGAADPVYTQPTVASQTGALNGISAGLTTLHMNSVPAGGLRIAIVDQRGNGRPDFNFGARVLYADAVSPSVVPVGGGTVTISGMGFRSGNVVKVNGVSAMVQSWSATAIVVTVPAMSALVTGSSSGMVTNVEVSDRLTGGTTLMTGALTYGTPQAEVMTLVFAPTGTVTIGSAAATVFAVRIMRVDGVTPVVGEAVAFSSIGSSIRFGSCGLASCTVSTDATGLASTTVTAQTAGVMTMLASSSAGSQTGSFTAVDPPGVMTLVSAPSGTVTTGDVAGAAFAVRVLKADGVTPVVGAVVVFSVGAGGLARFGACGTAPCTVVTDATGLASTTVTPLAAGTILLSATGSAGSVAAAFAAVDAANVMTLLSAPSGTVYVGSVATSAFAVRMVKADGYTPVVGAAIVFSASGTVRFGVCGLGVCTVTTDAGGVASTTVVPLANGAVTLSAASGSGNVNAAFTAANPPNGMSLVSAPAGTVYLGEVASTPFAVRVMQADGITPVVGAAVVFSASGAGARLEACGVATCTVVTDATGMATTAVTPLAVGAVGLSAVGSAGSETAGFTAAVRVRTVTALQAVEYVAAGATVSWSPQVSLGDNSGSVAGVAVGWTGSSGIVISRGTTIANAAGIASATVTAGPLAAGVQAAGFACGWGGTVCASFAAQGLDASALQVDVLSGAGQAVGATGTLTPVVLQVTDGLGHPVAGALVQIYQTVQTGASCPVRGRCPAVAVSQEGQSVAVTDVDGLVSVVPLQQSGVAEVTNVLVATGTQGSVSFALTKGW